VAEVRIEKPDLRETGRKETKRADPLEEIVCVKDQPGERLQVRDTSAPARRATIRRWKMGQE